MKLVTPVIECFDGLSPGERDVLFETFRVWLENDGSLRTAGELLFCHPNTVRYRLHRIEQRTGRSCRALVMSPNCAWHSRFIADSCGRRRVTGPRPAPMTRRCNSSVST